MCLKYVITAIWILAGILLLVVLVETKAHAQGLDGAMMGTFAWEMDRDIWTKPTKNRKASPRNRKFSYKHTKQDLQDEESIPRFSSTPKKTKSKKSTYKTASNCQGNSATWTVPDGTRSVHVSLLNSDGGLSSSYNISNYITIRPRQQVRISAKC